MVRSPITSGRKGGFVWTFYARAGQSTACCSWAEQGRKPGREWEASRSVLQSRDSDQGLGTGQWGLGNGFSSPSSWSLLNSICRGGKKRSEEMRDGRAFSIPLWLTHPLLGSHFWGGAQRDEAESPVTLVPFPALGLGRIPRGIIGGGFPGNRANPMPPVPLPPLP